MASEPGPEHDELRTGLVASAVAFTLWGTITVYWRLLDDLPPIELLGYRVVSSVAVLSVVVVVLGRRQVIVGALRDRRLLVRASVAAVALATNWAAYLWSIVHGHVIEVALGYFVAPLCTIALGVVVLRERLSVAQRVAVTAAASAVVVLTSSYGRVPIAALLIAVSWAAYGFAKKQVPLGAIESLTVETVVLLPVALVAIAVTAGRADSIPSTASTGEVLLLAASGIFTAVPLALFAAGARRLPLSVIAPLQYIVPTCNFLLGWLAYGEHLRPVEVAGFALIWFALVVSTLDLVHRQRAARTRLLLGALAEPA